MPFKDDFWTTSVQPGNPYGADTMEPNSVLEALVRTLACAHLATGRLRRVDSRVCTACLPQVATLSTGPVGPSDSIGHFDVDLIMRTCRDQGMLLKPDKVRVSLAHGRGCGVLRASLLLV